jgi:HNH endonuclease/AP2 domain
VTREQFQILQERWAQIQLSNGGATRIDAADLERVSRHVWHLDTQGYARAMLKIDVRWRLIRLHRFLTSAPKGLFIDHIDGDRLNNQRSNLRLCTPAESARNTKARGGSSRFKGVCWHRGAQKWMAQIQVDRVNHHLGLFIAEEDAATAYRQAALKMHGNFARIA